VLSQLTRGAFGTVERLVEYDEAARDSSVLVPDQQYGVVIAKDRAPADPVRLRVRPADGTVYLADARERSISDATYGEQLREYYGVQFDSLSTAERGIVEEAIDSEYTPESDDGDEESGDGGSDETNSSDDGDAEGSEEHPFESIAKRLVDEEPVVSTEQQSWWPVLYDGETYLTSLELVGYPDLERRLDRHEATPGRRHGRPAPTNEDDSR